MRIPLEIERKFFRKSIFSQLLSGAGPTALNCKPECRPGIHWRPFGRHLFVMLFLPNPKWCAGRMLTESRSITTAQSVVEHGLYGSLSGLTTTPLVLMQS